MGKWKVEDHFYLDGKPVKIISGAVHYFRTHPVSWYDRLYNLKAMGCNVVETYVPWNLHEANEGKFNFKGIADIEKFIQIAADLGLYIIVRPSPYICAEWEFGGLPAWLLKKPGMRIRSMETQYLKAVDRYYQVLLSKLIPYQNTNGKGPIIMMQIENEYGSFSDDSNYLKEIMRMMRKYGVTVPLFTSDGGWKEALESGALIEEDVLPTVNFGSEAGKNFQALKDYLIRNGRTFPLMCMEFWDGWFNGWGKEIIRRDPKETAEEVRAVLQEGSINLYMFHGGTNFGFYNGCSDMGQFNEPQITSYDYDAPLNEAGAPTEKFFEIQKVIQEECPERITYDPIYPKMKAYETMKLNRKVSLFSTLSLISNQTIANDYPLTFEQLDQNFGYVLYESELTGPRQINDLRLIDVGDRAQIFLDGRRIAIQDQMNLGENIAVKLPKEINKLQILIENLGRNNYGAKLIAPTQQKGIRGGVMEDIHYISNWNHYKLSLEDISSIDFSGEWTAGEPAFYEYILELAEEPEADTYLNCEKFGKGCVFVNGFPIGRFWEIGASLSLYVSKGFLNKGMNQILVFETEGKYGEYLTFQEEPHFSKKIEMVR